MLFIFQIVVGLCEELYLSIGKNKKKIRFTVDNLNKFYIYL